MVWNRTIEATMTGAPHLFHMWDDFFWVDEVDQTWRESGLPLHMLPFVASVLYIWMIYQLPSFLMNRPHLRKSIQSHIKLPMLGWNLFLCILSVFMFVGIGVPTMYFLRDQGPWSVMCNTEENVIPPMGSHIFWIVVFGYSKYLELLDTLFLILKNPERPIPFLHWYHHFSVLYFTWYACNWKLSIGLSFSIVNSCVHSFMYWYYFQKERGYDPIWAKPLTIGQILQMVFGLLLNILWLNAYLNGQACAGTRPKTLIAMGSVIYASYLFLFMKFFLERYVFEKKPSPKQPRQGGKKEE